MGSRYGGLKQMEPLGRQGEALLDYSVFDARRSGFAKAVFIIRRDLERDFTSLVLSRIAPAMPCEIVFQEADSLIPRSLLAEARKAGRTKPWGTAHALLCAREKLDAPFAVINADDFYGREAFAALGAYLSAPPVEGAIVPYRLDKTLSPQGAVTRGVCVIREGFLQSVEELTAIAREADGGIYNTGGGERRELAADTPVSMNCWAFSPAVFPDMEAYFQEFLKDPGFNLQGECYLPKAADWLIKNRLLRIRVLPADSPWFGVTYQADRENAARRIAELAAQGVYPPSLWGGKPS
jgi:hypothetical protein